MVEPPSRVTRQRGEVLRAVEDELRPGEHIVAVLPFAATARRPRGPEGKVRQGIYQSARRYRPLVATSSRLFVVNAFRTPYPRGVLADFPASVVTILGLASARFGQQRLVLDLPGAGAVPFDLGRFDLVELDAFRGAFRTPE